jgi:uncharacterized membrane protein
MAKEHFSANDQDRIVSAIKNAEMATSGELRVHIERKSDLDALARSKALFLELGMDKTELRNGVLIYLALEDKKFAISWRFGHSCHSRRRFLAIGKRPYG